MCRRRTDQFFVWLRRSWHIAKQGPVWTASSPARWVHIFGGMWCKISVQRFQSCHVLTVGLISLMCVSCQLCLSSMYDWYVVSSSPSLVISSRTLMFCSDWLYWFSDYWFYVWNPRDSNYVHIKMIILIIKLAFYFPWVKFNRFLWSNQNPVGRYYWRCSPLFHHTGIHFSEMWN